MTVLSVVTSRGAPVINTGGFNMLTSHTPRLRKYLLECVCVSVCVSEYHLSQESTL